MRLAVAAFFAGSSTVESEHSRVEALLAALGERGHTAELFSYPVADDRETWVRQLGGIRLIDLSLFCDRLICLSPLATLVRHSKKICWSDSLLSDVLPERFHDLDRRVAPELRFVPVTSQGGDRVLDLRGGTVEGPLAVPTSDEEWDLAIERLIAA